MTRRPLRTAAVEKPVTTGQRIRFARLECNLSQQALAAGVASITKSKVSKSTVSTWETELVNVPSHSNLRAIQAVTGFAVEWLTTGKGDQRASIRSGDLDADRLQVILKAIDPDRADIAREARIIALLYKVLASTPSIPPTLLAEMAQSTK